MIYSGFVPSSLNSVSRKKAAARQLLEFDTETFCLNFNHKPFIIGHHLSSHPAFTLERLVELSKKLPGKYVEYNAGDLPVSQDPKKTPRNGLSVEETIQRIEECRSWLVLKNVEQDPEYGELVHQCLDQIQPLSEAIDRGMCKREGFIFISSPNSITPYHMDNEHNFLMQIRGRKLINTFDRYDRSILSEAQLEAFFAGAHRNMPFVDEYQKKATAFELTAGHGLHIPITTPHWVKNGDEVSISFSTTFRTPATERRSVVYDFNAQLRRMGVTPLPYGNSVFRDYLKSYLYRALRRIHLIRRIPCP